MKIKVFEAFAGYGSQAMALQRLKEDYPDFDYEVVGISEIDKYVLQAYEAVHGHCPNYGDISKIDWNNVPDFDLFTFSFPCQSISNAGKQEGFTEGSGTTSSLLWECRKAIQIKRPQFLLMENVKALTSKKFMPLFNEWLTELESYGYKNFWKVLNTKDFGIPQNRERTFCVSILADYANYEFPQPFPLELRLKDILEENVDEKFYLSDKMLQYFLRVNEDQSHCHNFNPLGGEDTAFTIRTRAGQRVDDNFVKVNQDYDTKYRPSDTDRQCLSGHTDIQEQNNGQSI